MARDIKKYLEQKVKETVEAFQARPEVTTKFGEPVIGYVSAFHPVFDELRAKEFNKHPKEIYNPGHSVVVHYVPFDEEVIKQNEASGERSEEWEKAFFDAIHLSMYINSAMIKAFPLVGRLVSLTGVPTEWDAETHMPVWSPKVAAHLAGIGEVGPAGGLHRNGGYCGSLGSVITDGYYGEDVSGITREEVIAKTEEILSAFNYKGLTENIECSDEMIASCPAKAIARDGIDTVACHKYCSEIHKQMPYPDLCAKCFRFK